MCLYGRLRASLGKTMSDIQVLLEQFGAWAFVAGFAGLLLKYVINDLRKDNERNYAMGSKLHDRMDEVVDSLKYLEGKVNGKRRRG